LPAAPAAAAAAAPPARPGPPIVVLHARPPHPRLPVSPLPPRLTARALAVRPPPQLRLHRTHGKRSTASHTGAKAHAADCWEMGARQATRRKRARLRERSGSHHLAHPPLPTRHTRVSWSKSLSRDHALQAGALGRTVQPSPPKQLPHSGHERRVVGRLAGAAAGLRGRAREPLHLLKSTSTRTRTKDLSVLLGRGGALHVQDMGALP
jgi:hypothetical protein